LNESTDAFTSPRTHVTTSRLRSRPLRYGDRRRTG
jgi:hypothetical protein